MRDQAATSPEEHPSDDLTLLVSRWRQGEGDARDVLVARMLPAIRVLAERALCRLDGPVSLHPSDLAQESVIALLKDGRDANNGLHLRALAARIVRTTLIDYLRVRGAQKRGRHVTDSASISVVNGLVEGGISQLDLFAIHQALQGLEMQSPRAARIVEMRIFAGMTEQEIADVMQLSRPTIARDWAAAKLWLASCLSASVPARGDVR